MADSIRDKVAGLLRDGAAALARGATAIQEGKVDDEGVAIFFLRLRGPIAGIVAFVKDLEESKL